MKRTIKISLIFVLMIVVFLPQPAFTVGEYDGIWIGSATIYLENEFLETLEDANTIIYQQDEYNLYMCSALFGTIHLYGSGNSWNLDSSIETMFGDILLFLIL